MCLSVKGDEVGRVVKDLTWGGGLASAGPAQFRTPSWTFGFLFEQALPVVPRVTCGMKLTFPDAERIPGITGYGCSNVADFDDEESFLHVLRRSKPALGVS